MKVDLSRWDQKMYQFHDTKAYQYFIYRVQFIYIRLKLKKVYYFYTLKRTIPKLLK